MSTFQPHNVLAIFLTVEGLLFTALTVTVAVARDVRVGEEASWFPLVLAISAWLIMSAVAAGAVSVWADIYCNDEWPSSANSGFQAILLLVAIIAQPVLAGAIAIGIGLSRRSR